MSRTMLTLLAAGLLTAADTPKEDAVKAELQKLEGTWKVVALEAAGNKATKEEELFIEKLIIKGDKFTVKERGKDAVEMGFTIDPAQKPKALDLLMKRGDVKTTWPAVYALDGDELKICMPLARSKDSKDEGKPDDFKRPTGFDAKDKTVMLITAKREKP